MSTILSKDSGLSISSLAMLHQTLGITRGTLERILMEKRGLKDNLRMVKTMYIGVDSQPSSTNAEVSTKPKDNDWSSDEKPLVELAEQGCESKSDKGIGIELK